MFFTKFPHPANCSFVTDYDAATGIASAGKLRAKVYIDEFVDEVFRVRISDRNRWEELRPIEEMNAPAKGAGGNVHIGQGFELSFLDSDGNPFLETAPQRSFGVTDKTWMFCFEVGTGGRFFGMGEKFFGRLELSGLRTKFWNTDVWGDFHWAQWGEHASDPPYLSVPYVIVRNANGYTGILVNSGFPAFFETPGTDDQRVFVEWQRTSPHLLVGSEGGEPELWIIHAPDLRTLTRRFQKLVGVTPLPPLWSLGYHQSRWGYAGPKDLFLLHQKFNETQIPCDGLWLDIDYMDGYRVFSVDPTHFPEGVEKPFAELAAENRRVVAILDPGVKAEPGYAVYDDGHRKGLFCKNAEGAEYVGLVWPGETVFPDFTLAEARDWWADHVAKLRNRGFAGFWIDMNDPSTGPVDPRGMLFNNGKEEHAAHRNEYALGMQKASFDGLLKAKPDERPFLLSRSGCQGTSRYSAVWTGDNVSNYAYLRLAIPTTLNLSLSGIPFNGPDLGGFGGDSNEPLMLDWIRACFLFPFSRNHTGLGTREQEPWAYSKAGQDVIAKYIRLRYELLPYLYNLYADQEEMGDPILRPLFYEFDGDHDAINDQFLVGPSILQAPIVTAKAKSRKVALPGDEPWFDAATATWKPSGNRKNTPGRGETPLYIRNGAVIPMHRPGQAPVDLRDVEVHLFAAPGTSGKTTYTYRADDGLSYGYQRGERSVVEITFEWDKKEARVTTVTKQDGFGPIDVSLVFHVGNRKIRLNGEEARTLPTEIAFVGEPFAAPSTVLSGAESGARKRKGAESR